MNRKLLSILGIAVVILGAGLYLYPSFFPSTSERKVAYWTDPMIPGYKSPTPGKSPMGMEMTPVYEDELLSQAGVNTAAGTPAEQEIDYYTCTMHPSVKETEPGRCPLCGMDLTPVYKRGSSTTEKVDMTFFVSPAKRQLIGVQYATASVVRLDKTIHAVGNIEYDERALSEVNLKIGGWIEKLYVDYTGKRRAGRAPPVAVSDPRSSVRRMASFEFRPCRLLAKHVFNHLRHLLRIGG